MWPYQNEAGLITRDFLPPREVTMLLHDAFFDHVNNIFYVFERGEVKSQLDIAYEQPVRISSCWLSLLLFHLAVGAGAIGRAFSADSLSWYELGRKFMDDALRQSARDNLWITRATVLISLYHAGRGDYAGWVYLGEFLSSVSTLSLGQRCVKQAWARA
jgi:hypothetical protein